MDTRASFITPPRDGSQRAATLAARSRLVDPRTARGAGAVPEGGLVTQLQAAAADDEDVQHGDPQALVQALLLSGERAVAERGLAKWSATHAAVERAADRHVRLASALGLDELLLAGGRHRSTTPFELVSARAALSDLRRDPHEPARWALLGRLLARLGEGSAAAACDGAVRRLDPELSRPTLPEATRVDPARLLAVQAIELAATVDAPDLPARLSVVMIARDEEAMLAASLASVAPCADELVVVDTGSQDRTIEIARSFGAVVVERPWDGSFAAARNVSLDHASGDWVLWLDADERLVAEDAPLLRELISRPWREAAHVRLINPTGADGVGLAVSASPVRLWRHRPSCRFEGIVHEQIRGLPRFLPERYAPATVRILHEGYRTKVVESKSKFARNRNLLERQIAESTGRARAFSLYNLGVEHLSRGAPAEGLDTLERALAAAEGEGGLEAQPWGPMLALRLSAARRVAGDPQRAERGAAAWLRLFPRHTDLVLERVQCMLATDPEGALTLLDHAVSLGDGPAAYNSIVGASTFVAAALRGDILSRLGRHCAAAASYRRGLEMNPDYVAGVGGLARSLLAEGAAPEDVLRELRPVVEPYVVTAGGRLATALLRAGGVKEALTIFADMLLAAPGSAEARIGLASCALACGDTEAAAAYCDPLTGQSPHLEALARCALFCALVDGDHQRATRVLADPAAAGLTPGEVEFCLAWREALVGRVPPRLGVAAGRAALDAMRKAIPLGRLAACDSLHGLVTGSGLAFEDAHGGLAECFLGAGYTDLAGEEWLRVVEHAGPTGSALLGLARVASIRGDHEDALTLAGEAARAAPELALRADEVRRSAERSLATLATS